MCISCLALPLRVVLDLMGVVWSVLPLSLLLCMRTVTVDAMHEHKVNDLLGFRTRGQPTLLTPAAGRARVLCPEAASLAIFAQSLLP